MTLVKRDLKSERWKKGNRTALSHGHCIGLKRTKIYACWRNMLGRCYQPSSSRYKNYGARGIKVCTRWHNFENFKNDMGNPPSLTMSIERMDVHGDYNLTNCIWVESKFQSRNQSSNRRIIVDGEIKCVAEWAERLNLPARLIYKRLRLGWSGKQALGLEYRKKWANSGHYQKTIKKSKTYS